MKNRVVKLLKNKIFWLGVIIFLLGVFLRIYHFSDWLHFELDQARDVFLIADVIEGERDIPLLGPQARGRELLLGPVFYYFQILAGKVFGVTPATIAWPDLIFSILTIPLVYIFSRQFFSQRISFFLFTLTSFSFFMITYGRFAWNPNAMPFWSMLAIYALVKSSQEFSLKFQQKNLKENKNSQSNFFQKSKIKNFFSNLKIWLGNKFFPTFFKNEKFKTGISWWFILAIFSTTILVQLHFIAFLCFPIVFIFYFLFSKIQLSGRTWLASFVVIFILFLPIIISEYKTSGQNARGLFASVTENKDKDNKHDVVEKMFRNLQKTGTFFTVIFVSDQHGGDMIITKKAEYGYFPLFCDGKCKARLPYLIGSLVLFSLSLLTFIFYLWKKRTNNIENFLQLSPLNLAIIIWLLMGGLFLTLVAYQISPRFYLFLFPPFIVLMGSIFYCIESILPKIGKYVSIGLVMILVFVNLYNIRLGFIELEKSRTENVSIHRDLIMNKSDRITLGQLRDVADYIVEVNDNNVEIGKIVVGDNRYARAIFYLVNFENESDVLSCYMKRGGFQEENVLGKDYYLLVREKTKKHLNDEMLENHFVVNEKSFGTLKLYKLESKNSFQVKDSENSGEVEGCFTR